MEDDDVAKEAQLFAVIHRILEKNGELSKIKSSIRMKVMKAIKENYTADFPMMNGGEENCTETNHMSAAASNNDIMMGNAAAGAGGKVQSLPMQILNQLVKEYLQWFGFQYTMEMFACESGIELTTTTNRTLLEQSLGEFDRNYPILMNIIIDLLAKDMGGRTKDC